MDARMRAFDPASVTQAETVLKNVAYDASAYECAAAADALVIATEWQQFRALDLERRRGLMACPGRRRPAEYLPAGGDEPLRVLR
jgi:UDPglucose 6-dehydrogenase